jgi:preprotein translocase subunit Sss1
MVSTVLVGYGLFWLGILGVIVYLIFRRIRIKKEENFEKRDN